MFPFLSKKVKAGFPKCFFCYEACRSKSWSAKKLVGERIYREKAKRFNSHACHLRGQSGSQEVDEGQMMEQTQLVMKW